jgi:hypothetical protein
MISGNRPDTGTGTRFDKPVIEIKEDFKLRQHFNYYTKSEK